MEPSKTFDRRPLALRIRDEIADQVTTGQLQPGDQLASEADLVARYGVARTTVREALKLLEQGGAITVRHGVGRFVSAAVERPVTRLESVTEMMASLGYRVTNGVLSVTEQPAGEEEARALRLSPGEPVVRLERLRLQRDEPLIYSVDVVPAALIGRPVADVDWTGSLGDILAASGHALATATAAITAVTLAPALARRIGRRPGTPWLLLVQTNFTRDGRPVIYSHDYHRGDAFTFNVLRRSEPNGRRS